MDNLEQFRTETREWLDANCPDDMRQPMRSEDDQCWGGRNWVFASEGQQLWMERMAAKGEDCKSVINVGRCTCYLQNITCSRKKNFLH